MSLRLDVTGATYFTEAHQWWIEYTVELKIPRGQEELTWLDNVRWLVLEWSSARSSSWGGTMAPHRL